MKNKKNMTFSISAEQEKNDMQKHHTRTHIYKPVSFVLSISSCARCLNKTKTCNNFKHLHSLQGNIN